MKAITSLLPFVVVIGLMWLLLIRPQQVRQRQARSMLSELEPGDRVMTQGGLFGQVVRIDDDKVEIELAPGVTTTWLKAAISRIVQDDDESNEPDTPTAGVEDGSGTTI